MVSGKPARRPGLDQALALVVMRSGDEPVTPPNSRVAPNAGSGLGGDIGSIVALIRRIGLGWTGWGPPPAHRSGRPQQALHLVISACCASMIKRASWSARSWVCY